MLSRTTVLAFQFVDGGKSVFDFFKTCGISFDMAKIIAQRPGNILYGDQRRFEGLAN